MRWWYHGREPCPEGLGHLPEPGRQASVTRETPGETTGMKFSDDGFDARRLRSHGASVWRWRVLAALATLAAAGGVLLALAGMATLLGHPAALGPLNAGIGAASILVLC